MTRFAYKTTAFAAILAALATAAVAGTYQRSGDTSTTLQEVKPLRPQLIAKFDCRAQGTPVEFPDDLVIVNKGAGTLAAGTKINWRMENSFVQGSYVLPTLAPNHQVFVNNANPGGWPAGGKCLVWIVK